MNIAIIGWGSLIWRPADLPHSGTWAPGGPSLPIEFSRISPDGRLTLIIDPIHGELVTSRWSASPRSTVAQAVADLAEREICGFDGIGFADRRAGTRSRARYVDQPEVCATVEDWCEAQGFDAAVWTALPRTFESRTRRRFTVDHALDYLDALTGDARQTALEYVRRAPGEVDTPVRRAFRKDSRFRQPG